ncbi:MAG: hypothetical protein HY675_09620 [Chloroflexi bacterium]|nr:hypothetical protein [Chloroflexota bacterium]
MTKAETDRKRTPAKIARSRIPRFRTIQEEAEFWDTHSTAEFEDEFEEVKDVRFVVRRSSVDKALTVRLDKDTFVRLAEEARVQGVGPSTLVRMWILERLSQQRKTAQPFPAKQRRGRYGTIRR